MRMFVARTRRLRGAAVMCAAALAVGCANGSAESSDGGEPGAAPPSAAGPAKGAKFHVALAGGPFKGTYDVAAEACMANIQKPGSWHATWESDTATTTGPSAVLVGFDPRPTFGNGLTTVVGFGGDGDDKVLYEVLEPKHTVADRGATATLTFSGKARVVTYSDGSFSDGGEVTITIECGKVQRGPG